MTGVSASPAPAELLRRVQLLELVARRNAAGPQAGSYRSAVRGSGLSFEELRRYVHGEPARRIDWNITARLGEPYVKVHREERQRDVFVALDVSPSMHLGYGAKTKLELGVELAATLAVATADAGDRLGLVLFADQVLATLRPRGGRVQLFRVLRCLLEHTAPWRRPVRVSDPRQAVHAIEQFRHRRFLVFLISDFIDHDLPEDLKYFRAHHDVSLLHVFDPLEQAAPDGLRWLARTPEGVGSPVPWRPDGVPQTNSWERRAAELGMDVASLSTAVPVAPALGRFFFRRRRARR